MLTSEASKMHPFLPVQVNLIWANGRWRDSQKVLGGASAKALATNHLSNHEHYDLANSRG